MEMEFDRELENMINFQIIHRGIEDEILLSAMRKTPRHLFVPPEYKDYAYSDNPLPIGYGQTISQPYIVALMISLLKLKGDEHVLEVGTGCGYLTAILFHLVQSLISIEIINELCIFARKNLEELGITQVQLIRGDGSTGWEKGAPYDAILVSAAAPKVPATLLGQLSEGGKLILPVGERGFQVLEIWRKEKSEFMVEKSIPVAFVPLIGKHGWN